MSLHRGSGLDEKAVPIEWSRTGGRPELDVALRARLEASILAALESAMREATPVADVIPAVLAAIDRWASGAKLLAKQLALGKRRSSDMTLREHVTLVLRKWAVDRPPFEWRKHGIEPTDAMRGVRKVRPIVPRSSGLARYLLVIVEEHSGFRWADGDDPHWRTTVGGTRLPGFEKIQAGFVTYSGKIVMMADQNQSGIMGDVADGAHFGIFAVGRLSDQSAQAMISVKTKQKSASMIAISKDAMTEFKSVSAE
ncbi:MAG: hypothetical protein JWO36_7160 [Myxococcales bacterium]|nr:hypothetical protein [Myxococcales bacterium]